MRSHIEELLQQSLAREAEAAPGVDGLAAAARRRHRRRRGAYLAVSTAAAAGVLGLAAVALGSDEPPAEIAAGVPGSARPLPSSGWPESGVSAQALQQGVLTATDDGCFYLDRGDDIAPLGLLWPTGWTWTTTSPGTFEVRNDLGVAVMVPGDEIQVGGGYNPSGHTEGDICGVASGSWFPMNATPITIDGEP